MRGEIGGRLNLLSDAKLASRKLLQQERFDDFIGCYNHER